MRILRALVNTLNQTDLIPDGWGLELESLEDAAVKMELTFAHPPGSEVEYWLQFEINDIQRYLNKFSECPMSASPVFEWGTLLNLGNGLCTFRAQRGESIHIEICIYSDGNELMLEDQKKVGFPI